GAAAWMAYLSQRAQSKRCTPVTLTGGGDGLTTSAVSVIGLGKLGAPIAACIAAAGLEVVGVDTEPGKIRAVNAGDAAVPEPGLDKVMREAKRNLSATADL